MVFLEILSLFVVVCVAIVLILAMRKPDEFRVTRNAVFNAPAEAVFPYLNNLEKGQIWSPWVEADPDADYKFEGPKEGVGATIHWDGKKSGKGTMTIIESNPNNSVRFRLEMFKPMQAVNTVEYTLEPQGDQTKMTWTMFGPNNFMSKIVSIFMDCEKLCGDQFEKGLANLKTIVEKS